MTTRCEEAAPGAPVYFPCGKLAEFIVDWPGRTDAPVPMCFACADHNVRNRRGRKVPISVLEKTVTDAKPGRRLLGLF